MRFRESKAIKLRIGQLDSILCFFTMYFSLNYIEKVSKYICLASDSVIYLKKEHLLLYINDC